MVISTPQFMIRSRSSNLHYWEQNIYPEWTALSAYRHVPGAPAGHGVEPHYHDNDEMWLFTSGRGEVWLDGAVYPVTPNTLVYTPMGVVHRFQMFTPYDNNAIVTRLERQRRATHILVEEDGPPVPTVRGFVVPGDRNNGPIADPGTRCPLSEWRILTLNADQAGKEETLSCNEHWIVTAGLLVVELNGLAIELWTEDAALLRAGTTRRVYGNPEATVIVARERRVSGA